MKNRTNKILAVALAVTLLALAAVAGTLAYLTKETASITNVFTKGAGVEIELIENEKSASEVGTQTFTYTPDGTATKAVKVSNTSGDVKCYVFVAVEKGADFDTYASYGLGEGWYLVETTNETNEGNDNMSVYAYAADESAMTELAAGTGTEATPLFAGDVISFKNKTSAELEYWVTTEDVAQGKQLAFPDPEGGEPIVRAVTAEDIPDVSLTITAYAIQTNLGDLATPDAIWEAFWTTDTP